MEFKIVVNSFVYIEATANSEEERKDIVKGIQYTLKDLSGMLAPQPEPEPEKKSKGTMLASVNQKAFMDKLGIKYKKDITMVEASDAIRAWKEEHGYQTN